MAYNRMPINCWGAYVRLAAYEKEKVEARTKHLGDGLISEGALAIKHRSQKFVVLDKSIAADV